MAGSALNLNLTMGPIIIGAFFCVFFFGVICMQTVNYLKAFPNDVALIKGTVIFLWVLQLVYTICICQGAYAMSVTDFGEILALLFTPWGLNAAVVVGSLIDHGVQVFFVVRIYRATHALFLSLFLWTVIAFLQGVSLTLAAEAIRTDSIPATGQRRHWLLELLFFSDAALDIINACVLCAHLKIHSRGVLQNTAAVVDQIVVYTLQTGLATSMVALGAAVSFKVAPEDYIWTAFFMAMPGSFMSALLANVNHRKSLSQPSSVATSSGGHGTLPPIHFSRSVVFSQDRNPAVTVDSPSSLLELDKMGQPGVYGLCTV